LRAGTLHRPYFYEAFTLVNLIIIVAVTARESDTVVTTLPSSLATFGLVMLSYMVGGIAVRVVVGLFTHTWRDYLRVVRRPEWMVDSLRLVLGAALIAHTYAWIKLVVPLYHPRLFDRELWDLEQRIFFGVSPNIFFVTAFKDALRVFDWAYARVFFTSMVIGFGFFLSHPSRRVRLAFATGNSFLWIVGAWLYMAVPSLGPAYRFPEVWFAFADSMSWSHYSQAVLMKNYQIVMKLRTTSAPFNILFGIAAFPSLHVGYQTFVFCWMRRIWIYGQIVFGVFVLAIFIGSIVTGWHYMLDSIAGLVLGASAYAAGAHMWHIGRWLELRSHRSVKS
jgi:hypothetical protein